MTAGAGTSTDLGVTWHEVCRLKALPPERGAAAVVGAVDVALFRLADDRVFAVQQIDPCSGATVVSRCIVGRRGDTPTIASPMYRQVYDLRTGGCLDPVSDAEHRLQTFPVHVVDGVVCVGVLGRGRG